MNRSADVEGAKDCREAWGRFLLLNMADSELAKERLRKYLRKQTKQQIKDGFNHMHEGVLTWAIEYLGLPTEDYEICQALNEIISERPKK